MLTMKDIVRDGHPALRKKSKEVDLPLNNEDLKILDDMLTYLKNSQDKKIAEKYNLRTGVGLAAPQLGINKQLIVVHFELENEKHSYQLINPKIISHSVQQAYLVNGEGCLSVDEDIEGYVPRYHRITVRAYKPSGEMVRLRLRDYAAIVVQHEIDHLNGIMFYDHINKTNPFHIPKNAIAID